MRIGRTATALVTAAALLLAAGGSAFCVPASHDMMSCCKTVRPCGAGMKAADCCRFVPAAPAQAPEAVENSLLSKISREEMQGAAFAEVAWGARPPAQVFPQTSSPPLFSRDLSVPVYILNTSLRR